MARQRLPSLNARMRTRRSQLGLTGVELAQRAGISPSYVSLIEKGSKVPDEDVAAGLARALDDDEDLYRAWARASRLGLDNLDLVKRLEVIARTPAYVSLVESGQALPRQALPRLESREATPGRPSEDADLTSRLRQVASRLAPFPGGETASAQGGSVEVEVVEVPVLVEGADPERPDAGSPAPRVRDRLLLDRRLLGDRSREGLFAYEVTPATMKHLRGVAAPGDHVVFRDGGRSTPEGGIAPDRICAVRTGRGIVLARVLYKGGSLLLLPGEGESDFESVEVPGQALSGVVAGTHVLLIRR